MVQVMYDKIVKQIRQRKFSPLYVFYGTETYLQEELIKQLQAHVLSDGMDDFNYAAYDLEQEPVERLVQEAETLPFMGDKRLVVGRNAWFLTGVRGKSDVKHAIDALATYAEQPLDSAVVVLTVAHAKLDERKKLVKQLKKKGTVVPFAPLRPRELVKWVQAEIAQHKAKIDPRAAEQLVQRIGTELGTLHQECVKLATHAGEGGTVTPELVETMVPRTLEEDVFKLIDCLGKKAVDGALSIFYDLLKKREEPLKILSLIARQLRMMMQVKTLSAQGYAQPQIAKVLGVHPYPVKIAAAQAGRFSDRALEQLLLEASRTDYAIKSGQKEKTLAVEWYLLSFNNFTRAS